MRLHVVRNGKDDLLLSEHFEQENALKADHLAKYRTIYEDISQSF